VNLAAEAPPLSLPRSLIYCRFPVIDGEQDAQEVLTAAIQAVVSLLTTQIPTLVHCGSGMSRSPAVAATAFSIVQGDSPEENLGKIVVGHPHDVSPSLWEQVRKAC
jgi:predicted protein tyrosine phosphatase